MNKKRIAFDIGACQGESICKFEGYDEIYCFEPCKHNFRILEKFCENDSRIKCYEFAISTEEGISKFNFHRHYAYSSLHNINYDSKDFISLLDNFDPGFDEIESVYEVDVMRLDTFISENNIDHIDLLKTDTQGNDLNVIKSLGNFIGRVNTIELEVQLKPLYHNSPSREDIIDYMYKRNFTLLSEVSNGLGLENYEAILTFKNTKLKKEFYNTKKIPVIGTAVVNSSYWVKKLLESIDYPVDTFFIVNNNGKGELDDELEKLKNTTNKFVDKVKICNLPGNIGCSGAWNLIIKCFIMAPYWIIVNDDVSFDKGFLKEMIDTSLVNKDVGVINGFSGDYNTGSWDLFLIKDFVIEKLGLFDENCYPAYCEDADYLMRLFNSNIPRITSLKSNYFHGEGNKDEYYLHASQTSKKDQSLAKKLRISHDMNIEYLNQKWGPQWRGCSPNKLPFSDMEHIISETRYDLKFLRKKYTGF